jgi:predicted nucleic acid-binding protein
VRALLDTDILLDVALKREPFFAASAAVLRLAQDEPGQCSVAWHSLSNIAYIVRPKAQDFIEHLLHFVEVAPVETRQARQALGFRMSDLEDALQAASALAFDAYFIVSRNIRHYRSSPVPAITPQRFLKEAGRNNLAT